MNIKIVKTLFLNLINGKFTTKKRKRKRKRKRKKKRVPCFRYENTKRNVVLNFNGKAYNIISDMNESFSSVFEKFKNRSGMEHQNLNFYSDGEKLNLEMNLNQIHSNSIEAFEAEEVKGGLYSLNFTDISKQIHEELYFSDNAPSYRIVTEGINIFGICKVKKCNAYRKEVIVPKIGEKKFDLIKDFEELGCPECGGNVIPETLGFHLCKYKVSGKKFINDKIESFKFEGKAENKDSIRYFNPNKNGEAILVELKIEVEYL